MSSWCSPDQRVLTELDRVRVHRAALLHPRRAAAWPQWWPQRRYARRAGDGCARSSSAVHRPRARRAATKPRPFFASGCLAERVARDGRPLPSRRGRRPRGVRQPVR
jgi:hypothetical protein